MQTQTEVRGIVTRKEMVNLSKTITINTAKGVGTLKMDITVMDKGHQWAEINKINSSSRCSNQFNSQKVNFLKILEARFKMARRLILRILRTMLLNAQWINMGQDLFNRSTMLQHLKKKN